MMAEKKKGKHKEEKKGEEKKFESLKDKTGHIKKEKMDKMIELDGMKKVETIKDAKKGIPVIYAALAIAVVAVIAGVLIFSMPGFVAPAGSPVKSGDVVQILYTLKLDNGSVFDAGNFTFKTGAGEVIAGVDKAVIGMKAGEKKTVVVEPEDGYGYYDENKVFDVPLVNEMNRAESTSVEVFNMTFGEMPVVNGTYRLEGMVWDMRVASIENGTVKIVHEPQDGMTFDMKDLMGNVYAKGTVRIEGGNLTLTAAPIRGSTYVTYLGTAKIVDYNETYMTMDFNSPLASKTLTFDITLLNVVHY
jgi:peptidylprolyl isomerase